MKISYYPGCTLKSKAKNLDQAALASLAVLGVEVQELEHWNCCGAVASLAADDLIHYVAPVRNLIRAKEQGADKLITLCSMCYNTLARANDLMKNDAEKRKTINLFMDEEIDYAGEVEVVHYLQFLAENVGYEAIAQKVVTPLSDMKVGGYYGCTLQRPASVGIEPMGEYALMGDLFKVLGAEVIPFHAADKCCGSYQVLETEQGADMPAVAVLAAAQAAGINALMTSCPLCEYNLGQQQEELLAGGKIADELPVMYFTQALALALGVEPSLCHFELNQPCVQKMAAQY